MNSEETEKWREGEEESIINKNRERRSEVYGEKKRRRRKLQQVDGRKKCRVGSVEEEPGGGENRWINERDEGEDERRRKMENRPPLLYSPNNLAPLLRLCRRSNRKTELDAAVVTVQSNCSKTLFKVFSVYSLYLIVLRWFESSFLSSFCFYCC